MIVRVNKTKDYTVMSNKHLQDRRLTLKAKGLLSVVLALPENWEYSVAGLAAISKEKESSINSALKELKQCGYLVITKKMPNQTGSGRIEYEWDFFENPVDQKQDTKKQGLEFQGLEFQGLEFQGLENQGQLNTNILNNNIENTNKENTEDIYIEDKPQKKKFVPPTVEEVSKYCNERNNGIDPSEFVDWYQSRNWMSGKTKITDWKACVRTWERKNKNKPKQENRSSGNEFLDLLDQWEE